MLQFSQFKLGQGDVVLPILKKNKIWWCHKNSSSEVCAYPLRCCKFHYYYDVLYVRRKNSGINTPRIGSFLRYPSSPSNAWKHH